MEDFFAFLRQNCITYRENVDMRAKTTFRIGGPARLMLLPNTTEKLQACVRHCHALGLPFVVLGRGSNLLVNDNGIDEVVLSTANLRSHRMEGDLLHAQAGVPLGQLCSIAYQHARSGLEFAVGIPGSAGGAVVMNAGAFDGEMRFLITEVDYVDEHGDLQTAANAALGFGYRHSCFSAQPQWVVTHVTLQLQPGDPTAMQAMVNDYLRRRRLKQPLAFANAGSTFKRPPGHFASMLIDQSGLKGLCVGDAQVSEKHAGFIVNRGHATAADVHALMELVRQKVHQDHGVWLEPEIRFL